MICILTYFIIGILFYAFILPIIEQLGNLIISALELGKSSLGKKITKNSIEIQKMAEPTETTNVIGFQVPTEEIEFDDEEF